MNYTTMPNRQSSAVLPDSALTSIIFQNKVKYVYVSDHENEFDYSVNKQIHTQTINEPPGKFVKPHNFGFGNNQQ